MDNRAYAFAFMGVLGIICLGAYVAISALFDVNGDPLIRFDSSTPGPTVLALGTRASGTRTATPTTTPVVLVLPTVVSSVPTSILPTLTTTLPPLASPRPLPTRTPTTPSDTATPPPGVTLPPQPSATPTNPPPPGNYAFGPVSSPGVDHNRPCSGQYYIYGMVRDAQNQPLSGVRIHYTTQTIFPPTGFTEAKGYELTVGTTDAEWFVTIVDPSDRPLSPTVSVRTSGLQGGNCWYLLNWRKQ